jgi:hypothetical protein
VFSLAGARFEKADDRDQSAAAARQGGRVGSANPNGWRESASVDACSQAAARPVNYLIGDDPSKFIVRSPTYSRVRVSNVYTGINAIYYRMPSALEYDIGTPGPDASLIRFAIEGGASTKADASGSLRIATAARTIAMHKRVLSELARAATILFVAAFLSTQRACMK